MSYKFTYHSENIAKTIFKMAEILAIYKSYTPNFSSLPVFFRYFSLPFSVIS